MRGLKSSRGEDRVWLRASKAARVRSTCCASSEKNGWASSTVLTKGIVTAALAITNEIARWSGELMMGEAICTRHFNYLYPGREPPRISLSSRDKPGSEPPIHEDMRMIEHIQEFQQTSASERDGFRVSHQVTGARFAVYLYST